jgi:Skp family chaperone for outer membrane proteins
MNPKYEKICSEIEKIEEKIQKLQTRLNNLYEKRTEMENTEIISAIRSLVMDKEQLMSFLEDLKKGNEIDTNNYQVEEFDHE